jgi:hypothetical protein
MSASNSAQQATSSPALEPIGSEIRKTMAYVENVPVDNLYAIVIQLASALWVTRDRLSAIESLLRDKKLVSLEEIELHRVPAEREPQREAERDKFILDIFRSLRDSPG